MELKENSLLEEEQEMTEKLVEGAKMKKNLVSILKGLKSELKKKNHYKKRGETLIRINGFYHCPECLYKTKWHRNDIKNHINAVHRKLKSYKCLECAKGKVINICHYKIFYLPLIISDFASKNNLTCHVLSMHNTKKCWICDCCGSRFGIKNVLKYHMMIHLPPSFSCEECDTSALF